MQLVVRPSESHLEPAQDLGRDALPLGRVLHRLLLTFKCQLAEGGRYTPRLMGQVGYLYDGLLDQSPYQIYETGSKRLVVAGDMYSPEPHQLKKGDYTLRFALRHESTDLLEKFTDAVGLAGW